MFPISLFCQRAHFIRGIHAHPVVCPPQVDVSDGPHEPRVQARDQVTPLGPHDFDHGVIEALVPLVDVAFHQDHFGFWVRGDEVLGESQGGDVGDGAEFCEELVPLGAGEGRPFAGELCVKGRDPHGAVLHVIVEREGVAAGDPEEVECGLHGWGVGVSEEMG